MSNINTSFLRNVYTWLLMAVAFTMTFNVENVNVNGICIGLMALTAITFALATKQSPSIASLPVFILFTSLYGLHVVGMLYSQNEHEAWFSLEKKLGLALFPIIFLLGPKLSYSQIRSVMLSFVAGCMCVSIFIVGAASGNYLKTKDSSFFFYHSLSINAGMHAAYLAMYLCFSVAILLYLYFRQLNKLTAITRALFVFCVVFMSLVIYLLSARTQLVLLILGLSIYFIFLFDLNRNVWKSALVMVVAALILFGVALLFKGTRQRIKEAINYNNEYALSKKWGEKQMRYLIWKSALEASKNNIWFGVGSGDVQDELQKIYIEKEYISLTYFGSTKFNAHNQYFETLIGLGIGGLFIFFWLLFTLFKLARSSKNGMLLICSVLFAVSCLTESMLERQNGLVFFSFFTVFLLNNNYKIAKETT